MEPSPLAGNVSAAKTVATLLPATATTMQFKPSGLQNSLHRYPADKHPNSSLNDTESALRRCSDDSHASGASNHQRSRRRTVNNPGQWQRRCLQSQYENQEGLDALAPPTYLVLYGGTP